MAKCPMDVQNIQYCSLCSANDLPGQGQYLSGGFRVRLTLHSEFYVSENWVNGY